MGPHSRIRLRLTWTQRRAFVITVLVYQVLVWSDVLVNHGRFGGNARTAVAGAAFLVMAAAIWWLGTSLTQRGLVVHALPPRVIPWRDVCEIEVQQQLGSSVVVIHHGTGGTRHTRLAAPTTGPLGRDHEFNDKVRVMRSFWAAHRESSAA